MDNLDDSETNAKISDSAYSNSCSNSQSRRSHSSKSTHSGSHSSGSSGYGGKPKSYSDGIGQPGEKRSKDKDGKKKKQIQSQTDIVASETQAETTITNTEEKVLTTETIIEEAENIEEIPSLEDALADKGSEDMDIASPDGNSIECEDGFCCVISMQDGVVMYTTTSLTTALGFPKDMWIGRSFIDFVHPRDRNVFASHISTGFGIPKNVNGTQEEAPSTSTTTTPQNSVCTMVCRIRKYRTLSTGFSVKERAVAFLPFLLKLTFKNVSEKEKVYLVIQATPFFSAFKTPFEQIAKPIPFVIRHTATGNLEYLDPEAVPYLGYLPQDLADQDTLQLYHPDDLCYLRQVYEIIVREGAMARSKCYRLMTQNGDFVKVETEWASFINPWSRKLEFVIGKHFILEGPANPDVFQPPPMESKHKIPDEERKRVQCLRESIIRILTEVLTKPAEVAKQQMSKRCQDLASFMETLIENTPKVDEELRVELQETEHSYYERDSVMLGGISPHHDHCDSKSSTETPLSYNQLNYNETLERYFDLHEHVPVEEINLASEENATGSKSRSSKGRIFTPSNTSGDSGEISSSESGTIGDRSAMARYGDYIPARLTESAINKHNADMEKILLKTHRESRSSSKGERVKVVKETRQKKKEHLARCNAAYQPTSAGHTNVVEALVRRPHGLKRSSKAQQEGESSHKHHCSTTRVSRRRHVTNSAPVQSTSTVTTTVAATHWPTNSINGMNAYYLGVGMPQQMSIMSPIASMPSENLPYLSGMIPMYYAPAAAVPPTMPTATSMNYHGHAPSDSHHKHAPGGSPHNHAPSGSHHGHAPSSSHHKNTPGGSHHGNAPGGSHHSHAPDGSQHLHPSAMPCVMYGQALYGQPFMYSPVNHHLTYPLQPSIITSTMPAHEIGYPIELANSNYQEACKPSLPVKTKHQVSNTWREKRRLHKNGNSSNTDNGTNSSSSSNAHIRVRKWNYSDSSSFYKSDSHQRSSFESFPFKSKDADQDKTKGSEEAVYRTDGESSYSSFYSSFFKTESGSADDSSDARKSKEDKRLKSGLNTTNTYYEPPKTKKIPRRKMEPPWMDQVCVTSELVYKYQITTKSTEEVLEADKIRMRTLEQPALVNEQLEQLYLDLQLEGVAARLTLEEGITSSSSSGEESTSKKSETPPKTRRKREYNKLVMIYEEDAPLPPTPDELSPIASTSACFP